MSILLKNIFNDEFLDQLIHAFEKASQDFSKEIFLSHITSEDLEAKELKERSSYITNALLAALPHNLEHSLTIITKVAPKFTGLQGMIFPEFVLKKGIEEPDISIPMLKNLTQNFSSEFAIRPFIKRYPTRMIEVLHEWAQDKNHHVRRLASEGCRPRLPWSEPLVMFKEDPTLILPILELLKEDESEYVRRSVANNLNDISKDHPLIVKKIAKAWFGQNEKTNWIIRHACRTMLKTGDQEILSLFGFGRTDAVVVHLLQATKQKLAIGEQNSFTFDLINNFDEGILLRVEYKIDFVKSNGRKNEKIFKLSEKTYPPGTHHVTIKQAFKNLSTRKHYPGDHELKVVINGEEKATVGFLLTDN